MKLLFLTFLTIEEGNGISKKIQAQVQAFRDNGCEVHLMFYKIVDGSLHLFLDDKDFFNLGNKSRHFRKGLMFRAISDYIRSEGIDIFYFRYNMAASGSLISFLKSIRGACKRLIEIPTYPYDPEFKRGGIRLRIVNIIERYYRRKFQYCVDRFVTFVDDRTIYHVPTVKISNAVDINAIKIRQDNKKQSSLRMIAVANINFWHGFDRVIEGLYSYYHNKKESDCDVVLDIVGDGDHKTKCQLIKIVQEYKLQNVVTFYPNTSGVELDRLFDKADVAIGCLACHRKNIKSVKSLKNVEYAVRGVPFIYSEINEDFDEKSYVLKVAPDDSPIDICDVITFINNQRLTPTEIRHSADGLTWTAQMKHILESI